MRRLEDFMLKSCTRTPSEVAGDCDGRNTILHRVLSTQWNIALALSDKVKDTSLNERRLLNWRVVSYIFCDYRHRFSDRGICHIF